MKTDAWGQKPDGVLVKMLLLLLMLPIYGMAADLSELEEIFPQRYVNIKPPETITYSEDERPGRKRAIRKGRKAYGRQEYENSFEWFELATCIKGGSAISMYYLGIMNLLGLGTKTNTQLGAAYLEASAKAGFIHALFDLGYMHLHGMELEKNLVKAKACLGFLPLEKPKYRFYYGKAIYGLATNNEDKIRGLNIILSAAEEGFLEAQEQVKNQNVQSELSYLKSIEKKKKEEAKVASND